MWYAVDGEEIGGEYALICDNTGRHLYDGDGLSSESCFEFLLAGGNLACCFGLNYDVNNWIKDLPQRELQELWQYGQCYWRHYRLEWIPRKQFIISANDGRKVEICEVWGFFQSSFVQACKAWQLPVQDELKEMKSLRGTFSEAQLKRTIKYCHTECILLAKLMDKISLQCRYMKLPVKKWIGAGSIASAFFSREGMQPHHRYDADLTDDLNMQHAIRCAYFGGRIEAFRFGEVGEARALDINSAYPWAATFLPSLAGAKLEHRAAWDSTCEHSIWHVSWRTHVGMIAPFPTRHDECIYYPETGSGWYHHSEVLAAIRAGFKLRISRGFVLKHREIYPFAEWIKDAYELRRHLKAEGDHGEKVLKLGLNSVYGKLAQGKGSFGGMPPWQSYWWAGEITARTRAKMLSMACQSVRPLMIATDGIYAEAFPNTHTGTGLGMWSRSRYRAMWIGQPGVYCALDDDGVPLIRSRGFRASDVDYGELRESSRAALAQSIEAIHTYTYQYQSRKFIGLGIALQRKDPSLWRKWIDEPRALSLLPTRKIYTVDGALLPPPGPIHSEPYVPKGDDLDVDEGGLNHEMMMDQPLRT